MCPASFGNGAVVDFLTESLSSRTLEMMSPHPYTIVQSSSDTIIDLMHKIDLE